MQGKYDQAEPLHELAQTTIEKVLGPEHPRVAATLNKWEVSLASQVGAVRERVKSRILTTKTSRPERMLAVVIYAPVWLSSQPQLLGVLA